MYVIIPMFNAEDTVVRCLNSVIKQRYSFCHIICIDDASSDDTVTVCQNFLESNDTPYTLICQENNKGVSQARNVGLDSIPSEDGYVFFLDADDEIAPTCISDCVTTVENGMARIACCMIKETSLKSRGGVLIGSVIPVV